MSFSIAERLQNVRQRIQKSTIDAGRPESSVTLLAVSKNQPPEALLLAYRTGQRQFGESYVQEALTKQNALREMLSHSECTQWEWHFIGPIQSNKTRPIAERFDWVQSVDRLKIAQRLSEQRPESLPPLSLCIQVNIDAEDSKSGLAPNEVFALAAEMAALPRVVLRGLMAIPAPWPDETRRQQSFAAMRALFDTLRQQFPQVDTLSMGMTDDLELAIANGSTMVRVGTALFGERDSL